MQISELSSDPLIILDGAHNFDGIKKLTENLKENFDPQKTIAVVGMLKDKEYKKEIIELLPYFKKIIMHIRAKRLQKESGEAHWVHLPNFLKNGE